MKTSSKNKFLWQLFVDYFKSIISSPSRILEELYNQTNTRSNLDFNKINFNIHYPKEGILVETKH